MRVKAQPRRRQQRADVGHGGQHADDGHELQAPALQRLPGEAEAQQVLERAALPAQPLPGEFPPGQHHLGGHGRVLRGDDPVAQVGQRQSHPVVLGQRRVAVGVATAGVRQAAVLDAGHHVPQCRHLQQRPDAGDAQHTALFAGGVPGVARVLVPLQCPAHSAAGPAAEITARRAESLAQLAGRRGEEARDRGTCQRPAPAPRPDRSARGGRAPVRSSGRPPSCAYCPA